MRDPRRIKNRTIAWVEAKHFCKDDEIRLQLYKIEDKDKIERLDKEQIKEKLTKEIAEVSPTSVMGITYNAMRFSYSDPDALNDFNYGNVLLDIHLPYCLHLPNNYEMEINIPEENIHALVIFNKIWTQQASDQGKNSSDVDFYAEDRTIYFQKSTIITPVIPINPSEGWQQNFTGTNLEKIKDQNGVFRYSKLYVQFDYKASQKQLEAEDHKKILMAVGEKALMIVNRVLDAYRYITNQAYIERLGSLNINMIYFINHKIGFYILTSGLGIQAAPMNRSKIEVERIEQMLKVGSRPDLHSLLSLDTINSFEKKEYILTVVQSFQSLEIFLENLLFSSLINQGQSETDTIKYLDQHWRTKERLKECLKELKNTCLFDSNIDLWNKWCTLYDKTRNEIIHKGKDVNYGEAKEMIETNFEVTEWLKSI